MLKPLTDNNLLVTFNLANKTYNIYGEYIISHSSATVYSQGTLKDVDYEYPEFIKVVATVVASDGNESLYVPSKINWLGRKITAEDIICEIISSAILECIDFGCVSYLDCGLEKLIDTYKSNCHKSDKLHIPKQIIYGLFLELYQLTLLTDKFAYYTFNDSFLMFDVESHRIVSDNYFAEAGFWNSIKNIKNGSENLLYGEIPEDADVDVDVD